MLVVLWSIRPTHRRYSIFIKKSHGVQLAGRLRKQDRPGIFPGETGKAVRREIFYMALTPEREAEIRAATKAADPRNLTISERRKDEISFPAQSIADLAVEEWKKGDPKWACELGNEVACRDLRISKLPLQVTIFVGVIILISILSVIFKKSKKTICSGPSSSQS